MYTVLTCKKKPKMLVREIRVLYANRGLQLFYNTRTIVWNNVLETMGNNTREMHVYVHLLIYYWILKFCSRVF